MVANKSLTFGAIMTLCAVTAVCGMLLAPISAGAYVCSRAAGATGTDSGPSLSWFRRNITYSINSRGTKDLTPTEVHNIFQQSFAVWQNLTTVPNGGAGCSSYPNTTDLTLTATADTSSTFVGFDVLHPDQNENLLIFYDDALPSVWPGSMVIALTTNNYNPRTGEIYDSDIEFNSLNFKFVTVAACCPGCSGNTTCNSTDLQNTAVHEIGHFLGLAHSSAVEDVTMHNSASPGETEKRTLHCGERDGIALKYPAGAANGYCPTAGTCTSACVAPEGEAPNITPKVTNTDSNRGGGCQTVPTSLLAAAVLCLGAGMIFSPRCRWSFRRNRRRRELEDPPRP